MSIAHLFEPLRLRHGPALKNRLVLAPLTNLQSHADGRLSDEEFHWLTLRAQGGFALTMTCAAHVQKAGQGFPGQLGIYEDIHVEGLTRLAQAIKASGSVSAVQLHHAGTRAPKDLVGTPLCPSDDAQTGARALSGAEVETVRDAFVTAALRAQDAGFDGVEIHGAHGYLLAQFLSATTNRRTDRYGGSLENRARLIFEIIDGIRASCRPDFQLGLRISPERFGLQLAEMREFAADVLRRGSIDYLDLSLWDVSKEPEEAPFKGRSLLSYFAELPRGEVRVGAAGKILSAADAVRTLAAGCDFVLLGRAAILRHDAPDRMRSDPNYASPPRPVSERHLREEGLSPAFIDYMSSWKGFVARD